MANCSQGPCVAVKLLKANIDWSGWRGMCNYETNHPPFPLPNHTAEAMRGHGGNGRIYAFFLRNKKKLGEERLAG